MKPYLPLLLGILLITLLGTALIFYSLGYRIDVILVYPITPADLTPQSVISG